MRVISVGCELGGYCVCQTARVNSGSILVNLLEMSPERTLRPHVPHARRLVNGHQPPLLDALQSPLPIDLILAL